MRLSGLLCTSDLQQLSQINQQQATRPGEGNQVGPTGDRARGLNEAPPRLCSLLPMPPLHLPSAGGSVTGIRRRLLPSQAWGLEGSCGRIPWEGGG